MTAISRSVDGSQSLAKSFASTPAAQCFRQVLSLLNTAPPFVNRRESQLVCSEGYMCKACQRSASSELAAVWNDFSRLQVQTSLTNETESQRSLSRVSRRGF